MGYSGKYKEKLHAQELRKLGLSYAEIQQKVKVSKDTLSRWCREIELTPEQQLRLLNNKLIGQKKGSLIAAQNKRQLRHSQTEQAFYEASLEVGEISIREKFIAGIMLYAGEGDKGEGKSAFTNSDPKMIKFMINWFREFCKVPLNRFRGAIWLHEGLDEQRAKNYWSELTGIPKEQFHKTYISKTKLNSNKIRKQVHEYGIFSIRFSDTQQQRKILGWISAVLNDKIAQVH